MFLAPPVPLLKMEPGAKEKGPGLSVPQHLAQNEKEYGQTGRLLELEEPLGVTYLGRWETRPREKQWGQGKLEAMSAFCSKAKRCPGAMETASL